MIRVLGPSNAFLKNTSHEGVIAEHEGFANVVVLVSYGSFDVLLTGDSQVVGLTEAIAMTNKEIEVLHVPHHGSKSGLDIPLVDRIDPELAVISVGAKNRYGHPTAEIIKLLSNKEIKILRTDTEGDIVVRSDGKEWWVE